MLNVKNVWVKIECAVYLASKAGEHHTVTVHPRWAKWVLDDLIEQGFTVGRTPYKSMRAPWFKWEVS
jgi:hypothetical protein